MRVLVTGWRGPHKDKPGAIDAHRAVVWRELTVLYLRHHDESLTVVHGQCPYGGVDLFAQRWVDDCRHSVEAEPHPADWKLYGRAAGGIRNSEMVNLGADLCLGFPGPDSVGTWDCIKKAAKAGIRTIIVPLGSK